VFGELDEEAAPGADPAADLEAVHAGQHHVEQHELEVETGLRDRNAR
jgi:hypothetical protein